MSEREQVIYGREEVREAEDGGWPVPTETRIDRAESYITEVDRLRTENGELRAKLAMHPAAFRCDPDESLGQAGRTKLVVTFDVTDWTGEEIAALAGEAMVQGESSDAHPSAHGWQSEVITDPEAA